MRATRLPNGIRVLTEEMPDLPSVSLGLWVESGSRDETSEQAGISHFLEHLFFKGTERRTAARIAEDIDAVGGVLNAFTEQGVHLLLRPGARRAPRRGPRSAG